LERDDEFRERVGFSARIEHRLRFLRISLIFSAKFINNEEEKLLHAKAIALSEQAASLIDAEECIDLSNAESDSHCSDEANNAPDLHRA